MVSKLAAEDLYLSYLDALAEEDRDFSGACDANLQDLRDAYRQARHKRNQEYARPENLSARQRVDAAVDDAERAFRASLMRRLHAAKRSALCFSGGGIRSATFGLGVLQGLAACSRRTAGERPKLLGEFDYLSTVSGGGYLGAWFSGWAARLAKPANGTVPTPDALNPGALDPDGPAQVIERLAKSPDAGFEPEPEEVKHLRAYSNYLTPKVGALSGDTWTLASLVTRNMFLNWLVLLPLFAAALLPPVISWRLLFLKPGVVQPDTLWFLLIAGLAFGGLSVAYVGCDLPNAGNRLRTSKSFMLYCLLPIALAAIHLSTFWAWLPPGESGHPWFDVVALGKSGISWWHFALFGMILHGCGMLLGIAYVSLRFRQPPPVKGLIATVAATGTGFVGGLIGFLAAHVAKSVGTGRLLHPKPYAVIAFPALMGIFLLAQTLLVGLSSYITEDEDREWWARAGGWFLSVALAWLAFGAIVLYSPNAIPWGSAKASAAFTAATGITGWAAARIGKSPDTSAGRSDATPNMDKFLSNKLVKEYGTRFLLPAFLILLTMLLGAADIRLVHLIGQLPDKIPSLWPGPLKPMGDITAHALWLMLAYIALGWGASYFININKFSLHGMYRMRLIRAYLGASNTQRRPNPFTGFDKEDNIPMSRLAPQKPLHVVNMTLNLVHGSNLAWQQRKAESFTSTRLHTGSCRVGYQSSAIYGGCYKSCKNAITLGTAMTISGAAASPNMGYHSSSLLSLVMTLFNARLGWWLGNPRSPKAIWSRPGPRYGILPFIDEAFGLTSDTNRWLYLSDGGHFENLGIYEMVLRRCHCILVSDAGADPDYNFEDLANAVRKIRVDLGIPIDFEKPAMAMSPSHRATPQYAGHHCAIGWIRYGAIDTGAEDGLLIYIKASLNGNETPDIQHYGTIHKSFPQQPTSDQFYDESQFESYRRLGLHVIEEICGADYGSPDGIDFRRFVEVAKEYCARDIPATVGIVVAGKAKEEKAQDAAKAAAV